MKLVVKKHTARVLLTFGLVILFGALTYGFGYNYYLVYSQKLEDAHKESLLKKEKKLGTFVIDLMNEVNVKLSKTKKQVIAQTFVRVANDVFTKEEQKYQFALILALESRFDNSAKSPSGAVGIAQVIPRYVKEFASRCGLEDVSEADLTNVEISILVGACQFRALINHQNIKENIALALFAYNAGINSRSFQDLVGMKNTSNLESANYVTKFTYLSNVMKLDQKLKEGDKK